MEIEAELFSKKNILKISQHITYYNTSQDTLKTVILRNWANSYKNDKTPLAKRLLEDYKTDFYFSKDEDRGYSQVNSIKNKNQNLNYHSLTLQEDLIRVNLNKKLNPGENIRLSLRYVIKIPHSKFTGNGKKDIDYYLKDWHITPAPYENRWILDSHKNLNYQYNPPTDYTIKIKVPIGYQVHSNFHQKKTIGREVLNYQLYGKNIVNADISISFLRPYLTLENEKTKIITDFFSEDFEIDFQKNKIQQMMFFLKKHLGNLPRKQILVEKENYNQNPIYELKYLPKFLHPFEEDFTWELMFFKTISSEYVDQMILSNKYKDYAFNEGIKNYMFIKYLDHYFPDATMIGRLSKVWGLKSMNLAKSKFADKFSIVHQITARENLDQSLMTPLENQSNYNKKIITPYKSGLGFVFLEQYIGKEIMEASIKEFIHKNINKKNNLENLIHVLEKNSKKDLTWFMKEWIYSNKKIDHTIASAAFEKDSVYITLQNKRSIKTPVSIYGLKNNIVKSKIWTDGFTDLKKIAIKNDHFDKITLNYLNDYPEINKRNNWKNSKPKLFERPLKIKLLKDLNDPNSNEVFVNPELSYNYYDGIILGIGIQNEAFIPKNFEYKLKPTLSTASKSLTGGFNISYAVYPEKTRIYRTRIGINGSNYHYTKNLNYNVISPYLEVSFKQKNIRFLGTNKITARFLGINKEVNKNTIATDDDKYQLLKLSYDFRKNQLIHDYKFNLSTQIATRFSKITTLFRYRHLTNRKHPVEFRFFGGLFLRNTTMSDYFSFNQHTANDYLFELPYLGRSESSGFLTQQYVRAEGGFVTQNGSGFSNQWLTSINTSIGIVRWVEAFNNISLSKNKSEVTVFDYEGGIRLNFAPNLFEIHFPLYNKEGFLTRDINYFKKVRFTILLKTQPLIRFFKQQLF